MINPRSIFALSAVVVLSASCTGSDQRTSRLGPSSAGTYRFDDQTDCTMDVSASLNAFIAEVPNGATISFEPDACYRIDDTVEVVDKYGLAFEGSNATFKTFEQGDQGRRHWVFSGGGDFTIRNLTVVGANPSGGPQGYDEDFAFQHGFSFEGVDGAVISDIAVTDVYGDFLRLGKNRGTNNRGTNNVMVRNSRFERSGRQGIALTAVSDIVIEGNSFNGVGRSVFDIEPNSGDGGAQRVRLADNDLAAWGNLVLPVGGKGEVNDIELVGNRLHGKQLDVLIKEPREEKEGDGGGIRRRNITIVGNVSDALAGQTAVNSNATDGLVVRDNVQPFDGSRTTVALRITQSCDVTIEGNRFDGATTEIERDDYPCP